MLEDALETIVHTLSVSIVASPELLFDCQCPVDHVASWGAIRTATSAAGAVDFFLRSFFQSATIRNEVIDSSGAIGFTALVVTH